MKQASKKKRKRNKVAKINFNEVEEGFPLWPEGEYPSTLSEVELKKAKSGHYGFNLQFDPESEEVTGKAFANASLHPNALWRTKQTLMRLGLDPDVWADCGDMDSEDEDTLKEFNEKVRELIGNEAVLIMTHQDYEGEEDDGTPVTKTRNNVEKILSAGATQFASLK